MLFVWLEVHYISAVNRSFDFGLDFGLTTLMAECLGLVVSEAKIVTICQSCLWVYRMCLFGRDPVPFVHSHSQYQGKNAHTLYCMPWVTDNGQHLPWVTLQVASYVHYFIWAFMSTTNHYLSVCGVGGCTTVLWKKSSVVSIFRREMELPLSMFVNNLSHVCWVWIHKVPSGSHC